MLERNATLPPARRPCSRKNSVAALDRVFHQSAKPQRVALFPEPKPECPLLSIKRRVCFETSLGPPLSPKRFPDLPPFSSKSRLASVSTCQSVSRRIGFVLSVFGTLPNIFSNLVALFSLRVCVEFPNLESPIRDLHVGVDAGAGGNTL